MEVKTMRVSTIRRRAGFVSALGLIAPMSMFSTQAVQAADQRVERAMVFAPRGESNRMASGAAEDTLQACLARIPQNASFGQRMLAEQSCAGEERARKSIQLVPKF
jgi:hypothetical protein